MAWLFACPQAIGAGDARLEPSGVPISRVLPEGEAHTYRIDAQAHMPIRLEVTTANHPVVVTISDHSGHVVLRQRTLIGSGWTEAVTLRVTPGDRLTVEAVGRGQPVGAYRLQLSALAFHSERHREALQAAELFTKGRHLGLEQEHEARQRAMAMLGEARLRFSALGDRRQELQSLIALLALALEQGEHDQAGLLAAEALLLAVSGEDRVARAWILDRLAFARQRRGQFTQALAELDQAVALWTELDRPSGALRSEVSQCGIRIRQGSWFEARACVEQLLPRARELGETRLETDLRVNSTGVFINLGEPEPAIETFQRLLELSEVLEEPRLRAQTYNNLGALLRRLGEAETAVQTLHQALGDFRQVDDVYWQARALNNIGFAYLSLGDATRARPYLEQALLLRQQTGDRPGQGITLRNLGRAAAAAGDSEVASDFYRRALEIARSIDNRRGEAAALLLLGLATAERGDLPAARATLDEALAIYRDLGNPERIAETLLALGAAQMEGPPEVPQEIVAEAVEIYSTLRDPFGLVEALALRAHLKRRAGRLEAALEDFFEVLERVEKLRAGISDPTRRAAFLASRHGAYEATIDLLMELHQQDPAAGHDRAALEVSERARARTLLDLLERPVAERDRQIPERYRRRHAAARRRLNAQVQRQIRLLAGSPSSELAQQAETEVHRALETLEAVEASIRLVNPRYASLHAAQPVAESRIRSLADDGTVLLAFALGQARSFAWLVSGWGIESFVLPGREEIEKLARQTHCQLRRLDVRSRSTERTAARELARHILAPVWPSLPPSARRLVLIADGALHMVPFAVLPQPESLPAYRPLLERFEVVMASSASSLDRREDASKRPGPGLPTVAIVADPAFDSADFPPLPHSREEARSIAALLPPEHSLTALGRAADRSIVAGDAFAAAEILHFATHGVFHARDPRLTGLMLAPESSDEQAGGFLNLLELLELELAARLVVLSGCHTALGQEVPGEGLVGMARGFRYVGVPRVVASLWRVEDRATASLMQELYRRLLVQGTAPAAALRQAQLALRRERRTRDPFFWGAFVFYGDWRPWKKSRDISAPGSTARSDGIFEEQP